MNRDAADDFEDTCIFVSDHFSATAVIGVGSLKAFAEDEEVSIIFIDSEEIQEAYNVSINHFAYCNEAAVRDHINRSELVKNKNDFTQEDLEPINAVGDVFITKIVHIRRENGCNFKDHIIFQSGDFIIIDEQDAQRAIANNKHSVI